MKGPILVVDDNATIRQTVSDLLELEGYAVVTAANGAEALRTIARAHPAVVVLDIRMPILDGPGLAKVLQDRAMGVPLVVMSADPEARRAAAEIGAEACITKPFDVEDLLAALERVAA
jgi:CheY-like chemotaxis protein